MGIPNNQASANADRVDFELPITFTKHSKHAITMGLFDFFKRKNKDQSDKSDPQKASAATSNRGATPAANQGKGTPSPQQKAPAQADIQRFEEEFHAAMRRYLSSPTLEGNFEMRDQKTGEKMPLALALPAYFETWLGIRSLADRRGVIYKFLDEAMGGQLQVWQEMERYTDDRYAYQALELSALPNASDDTESPDYLSALAKANFVLMRYKEAEEECLQALQKDPTHIRTKRVYADILHTTGRQEEAHKLYEEIIASKIPEGAQGSVHIFDLLGFQGDIVNSPVYAYAWLSADPNVTEEIWDWAAQEFYYSPHFRAQHAYHLVRKGEEMKAFAKILALSEEMPWFKEAIVNAYNWMHQLNIAGQFPEKKAWLESVMKENGW